MRRSITSTLTVFGAVCILVLAANTVALAATGKGFILGKINSANKQTTLARTTVGPALGLVTKSSANPPLKTNGKGKVTNLNADRVDNLEGSSLQTRPIFMTAGLAAATFNLSMPLNLPVGTYQVSYSVKPVGATAYEFSCWLAASGKTAAHDGGVKGGTVLNVDPAVSGAGLITSTSGSTGTLFCWSDKGFTVQPGNIQVVATRVDGVTVRPLAAL